MPFVKVEISSVLPSSFVPGHSSFLPLSVTIFLLSGVASNSWVCARQKQSMCKGEVCHLFQLVPLRGFGGLPNKWLATVSLFEGSQRQLGMCKEEYFIIFSVTTFPLSEGARGRLSPTAYGLRPSASSSFFRLETLFLSFFALLYYTISQLFIYSSYTNRPRFV